MDEARRASYLLFDDDPYLGGAAEVPVDPPVADFSADVLSGSAPLRVQFTDLSTNAPTAWHWDFGDGGESFAQHPVHFFSEGTWTVTLTATNAAGSDQEAKADYITVTAGAGGAHANLLLLGVG